MAGVKWYQRHAAALATNDGTGIGALQADLERHYGLIGRHLITEICDLLATSGNSWRTHRSSVPLRAWLGRFCLPVARRAEFDESVELMLDVAAAVNSYAAGGLDPTPPFCAIEIDIEAQLVHLHWPPFADLLGTYQRELARRGQVPPDVLPGEVAGDVLPDGDGVDTPCTGGVQGVDTPGEEPANPPATGRVGGARKKGTEGRGKRKKGGGQSKSKSAEGGQSPAPKARRAGSPASGGKKAKAKTPPTAAQRAGDVAGDVLPGDERVAGKGGAGAAAEGGEAPASVLQAPSNEGRGQQGKMLQAASPGPADAGELSKAKEGHPGEVAGDVLQNSPHASGPAARRILSAAMERHGFDYAASMDEETRRERLATVLGWIDAAIENYGEEPVLAASLAADVTKALDPCAYLWQAQAAWYRQKEWRRGLPKCAAPGCTEKGIYTWASPDGGIPLCGAHHKQADDAAAKPKNGKARKTAAPPASLGDIGRQIIEGMNDG